MKVGEEARRGAEGSGGAEGERGEGRGGDLGLFWTGLLRFASLRAAFGRRFAFGYLRFASVRFGRLQDRQDLQDGWRRMEGWGEL